MQETPADRTEDQLTEEEWCPDCHQEPRHKQCAECKAGEDRGSLDRAADVLEFGPSELEMRVDQAFGGVTSRPYLFAETRRVLASMPGAALAVGPAGCRRCIRR